MLDTFPLPLTSSDVESSKAGVKPETPLTRRNWLRSSALTAGAAGFLSSSQQAVIAAPTINDDDPGVFNVLAFGAKGDAKADDTDAIQRAIDAAGNYSSIHQQNANGAVFDDGSSGLITGDGSFGKNTIMDVDVSRNKNPASCIRTPGSTPWPFYPALEAPASGNSVCIATGTNCMVYITRGKVKEIVVDGTSLGAQTAVYVPVNRSVAVRYTGELEWIWQRLV